MYVCSFVCLSVYPFSAVHWSCDTTMRKWQTTHRQYTVFIFMCIRQAKMIGFIKDTPKCSCVMKEPPQIVAPILHFFHIHLSRTDKPEWPA